MSDTAEQHLLLESTVVTVVLAVGAVGVGFIASSRAIVFDGLFGLIEVPMGLVALLAARLASRDPDRRFQYGYWHVEPLALAFNSGATALLCVYGIIDSALAIMAGGREIDFGWSVAYFAVMSGVSLFVALRVQRANADLGSELLALDEYGWKLAAWESAAALLAFGFAWASLGTRFSGLARYVDPLVVAALCLVAIPVLVRTFNKAVAEILLITPADLHESIRNVMDEVVAARGFLGYTSHATKVGRGRFIEIHILVPADTPLGTAGEIDELRDEIAEALDADGPRDWLTIDFTADREWT